MHVLKQTQVSPNCYFQVGDETSWGGKMPVVRLAYYVDGRFSRSGSSELCIEDAFIVAKSVLEEGLFSKDQKAALKKLLV